MPKMTVGQLIRKRREDLALTQSDLGKLLGLKYGNFIGMLETGKASFPLSRALDYAEALDLEPAVLLEIFFEEMYPELMPYLHFVKTKENG